MVGCWRHFWGRGRKGNLSDEVWRLVRQWRDVHGVNARRGRRDGRSGHFLNLNRRSHESSFLRSAIRRWKVVHDAAIWRLAHTSVILRLEQISREKRSSRRWSLWTVTIVSEHCSRSHKRGMRITFYQCGSSRLDLRSGLRLAKNLAPA